MRTSVVAIALLATNASGYAPPPPSDFTPGFELTGHVPAGGKSGNAGSRIISIGDETLAVDADSGQLILVNAKGFRIASLELGAGAGLAAFDPATRRAYVADRAHDRIAVVTIHGGLELASMIATPREPYGVAIDHSTLLVTSIADRVLVAYDTATGGERWRESVGAEPRAVAIAPDGKHALVTHLTTDSIEMIDLATRRSVTRALRHDLGPECEKLAGGEKSSLQCADPEGTSFARGAYAGIFLGNDLAAVAFQRETPVPRPLFAASHTYGGSAIPITRHVAFVGATTQAVAQVGVAEPRALAYDAARDLLYVGGMGDGHIVMTEHSAWADTIDLGACGIDGLAIAADGDLLAWCSFTRSIARVHVEPAEGKNAIPRYAVTITPGSELAPTTLSETAHAGMISFHTDSREIARFGRAACASCHIEGRSDGMAWQIEGHALRTPVLAGRIAGTAPYKWAGRDADLDHSILSTIDRLGGHESTPRSDLAAYLESLALPPAPTTDSAAVARGKALFESSDLACAGCHGGAELTDHAHHMFTGAPFEIDTPSLRGAHAAPRYLHDGSAATLDDVLAERGSIKGMIARPLSRDERADLAAFLRTL